MTMKSSAAGWLVSLWPIQINIVAEAARRPKR